MQMSYYIDGDVYSPLGLSRNSTIVGQEIDIGSAIT